MCLDLSFVDNIFKTQNLTNVHIVYDIGFDIIYNFSKITLTRWKDGGEDDGEGEIKRIKIWYIHVSAPQNEYVYYVSKICTNKNEC